MGFGNILRKIKTTHILAVALICFAVVMRLVPHPANFAPITAIAIFGAYKLPGKSGIWLPLIAMLISDLIIGTHPVIFWTWGAFALIALISRIFVKRGYSADKLIYASMTGSVLFFVVTNFGVWAEGWLYPRTLEGLASSYYNALPFFRNTLMGDLFYTFSIFAAFYVVSISIDFVKERSVSRVKLPV